MTRNRIPRSVSAILASIVVIAGLLLAPETALAASGGACVDDPDKSFHGPAYAASNTLVLAVDAHIDPFNGYFYNCGELTQKPSAASAWVGVAGNSQGIIQLGITVCDSSIIYTYCDGDDTIHYVYQINGCAVPVTYDLGPADFLVHDYTIQYQDNDGKWHLYIDYVDRAQVNTNDPNVYCWIGGPRHAEFFGERLNRGDSIGSGTSSSTKLNFTGMRWVQFPGVWTTPTGTGCIHEPTTGIGRSFCTRNGGTMSGYTIY